MICLFLWYQTTRTGEGKEKKHEKNHTQKKTTIYFLTGYFLAFAAFFFSELDRFTSNRRVKNEECRAGAIWSGNTEGFAFFYFSLFIFPFILRPWILFPFFPLFFPYLPSFSFIHHYFSIAALGGFNLYTHSLFSSSLYNLAYFFSPSSSPYNYLSRCCFLFVFSSDFCEFLFLSGHYIDHKNKELASASNLVFFEFILFYFLHIITHSSVHCACLFLCVPFFPFLLCAHLIYLLPTS